MKNSKKYLFFIFVFISLVSIQSCNKENNSNVLKTTSSNIFIANNTSIGDFKVPDGTLIELNNEGSLDLTYPEGIELWVVNGNGSVDIYLAGGYTCGCSGSGGCDVLHAQDQFGCGHGSCSGACTGAPTFPNGDIIDLENAFFVEVNKNEIKSITSNKDFGEMEMMPDAMYSLIKAQLDAYATYLYGSNKDAALNHVDNSESSISNVEDIVFVPLKIYGYKFIYGISVNDITIEAMLSNDNDIVVEAYSCICGAGSGCDKDGGVGYKKCKGGDCSSCTMELSIVSYSAIE